MSYYYSFDIGGTYIKSAFIKDDTIIFKDKTDTQQALQNDELANVILKIISQMETKTEIKASHCKGLSIGSTGLIDSENGIISFSGVLKLHNYPLVSKLKETIKIPIILQNDATIATLAEQKLGNKQNFKNFLFLTLGTGIGGDIVVDDKVFGLTHNYSFEVGHIKITDKKEKCQCGDYGCFEALASTSALVKQTISAMKKNKDSLMWNTYNLENVTGKTVFEYKDIDETAKQIFDDYIQNLGKGIVSILNIFPVDAVYIGGAISHQELKLIKPLQKYVDEHLYISNINKTIPIYQATSISDAGVLGGIYLFK